MSKSSAGIDSTKTLEDLIADTQSWIQALDRRLRSFEEASRVAARQGRTNQVPVEDNSHPLPVGATAPSITPTLIAPKVPSYRVYLREYVKRGRQRRALRGL